MSNRFEQPPEYATRSIISPTNSQHHAKSSPYNNYPTLTLFTQLKANYHNFNPHCIAIRAACYFSRGTKMSLSVRQTKLWLLSYDKKRNRVSSILRKYSGFSRAAAAFLITVNTATLESELLP